VKRENAGKEEVSKESGMKNRDRKEREAKVQAETKWQLKRLRCS